MFEVSKDHKLPDRGKSNAGRKPSYPWREMPIGSSFFVPGGRLANLSALCYQRKIAHGEKYTCRTVDGGVRVWRVEADA